MTETCPFCQAEVLFTNDTCPRCRNNRQEAMPETIALWTKLTEEQRVKDSVSHTSSNSMASGLSWLIGGGLVTWSSYNASGFFEGQYVIASGAMVYGACKLLAGLYVHVVDGRS